MRATPITIVFFGTPMYAVPTLEALAADPRYRIALVVTQPDRQAGRGLLLQESPVRTTARRLGLDVYQPNSLRDPAAREPLEATRADLFVVAAYGLIFGRRTLAIPRFGCLNLHASLLPAYRGASPVAAAILSGDAETGVSLMVMEAGLDMGPVVERVTVPIAAKDTTASLTARLGDAAALKTTAALDRFIAGDLAAHPQDPRLASTTRPMLKADGWLNWTADAVSLECRVRAMWPWPRGWTTLNELLLQVHAAEVLPFDRLAPPGTVSIHAGWPIVTCGEGALRLDVVQIAGGNPMDGRAFVAGRRVSDGQVLGETGAPEVPPPLIVASQPT